MKKTTIFKSVWAEQMQQFVAFKRMQGYDYSSQARKLGYFDRFVLNETDEQPATGLSLDLLRRYVETIDHQNGFSRQSQLGSLREFSRYLHARLPRSEKDNLGDLCGLACPPSCPP